MATSQKAFEHTATGVLGDKRTGMLSNELHLRVSRVINSLLYSRPTLNMQSSQQFSHRFV